MEELFQQIKLNEVKRKLVPIGNENGLLIEEYIKDNDKKDDNNVKNQGLKINEKIKSYRITNNYTQSNAPLGQIKSVLLSLADEEQIERQAVCEVYDTRLYNRGLPRLNSCIDVRLGPSSYNDRCVTCRGSIGDSTCNGHSGFTRLQRRVYLPQYITEIYELLQCICWRCSRILIDTNSPSYQSILKIKNAQRRRQKLMKLCSSVQWCGGKAPEGFVYPNEQQVPENNNNKIVIGGGKKNSKSNKLVKFDAEKYIHNRSQGCGALQLSFLHVRKDWLTLRCFSRIPVNQEKNIGRKSKKNSGETTNTTSKKSKRGRKSNESGDEDGGEDEEIEGGEEDEIEGEDDQENVEEKEDEQIDGEEVENEADDDEQAEGEDDGEDEKEDVTDEEEKDEETEQEEDEEEIDAEKQKPEEEQETEEEEDDDDEDSDSLGLHLDDDEEEDDDSEEDNEILNNLHLPNMDDENEFMEDINNNSGNNSNNNNKNIKEEIIVDPTQLNLPEFSPVNFVSLSTFKKKKIPSKLLKNLPPLDVEQSFTPDHAYQIFKRIRESDYYILGFVHYSKPYSLCPRVLFIPGNPSRIAAGSKTSDGKRARENSDFTKRINRIIQFNLEAKTYYNTILEKIKLGQSYHKEYRSMLIAIENVQISLGEYICRDDLGMIIIYNFIFFFGNFIIFIIIMFSILTFIAFNCVY